MPKDKPLHRESAVRTLSEDKTSSYLTKWVNTHRDTFEDCMSRLADELPQKYAEIYIKMISLQQQSAPKPSKTDINTLNVNVGKLDALADVKDTSWRQQDNNFTPYEEVTNGKK